MRWHAAGIELEEAPPPAEIYTTRWRVGHVIRTVGDDLFLLGHDNDDPVGSRFGLTRHGTLFAVYDFLENQMGVRWLWPGELGEVIPQQANLTVDAMDASESERFAECEMGRTPSDTERTTGNLWLSFRGSPVQSMISPASFLILSSRMSHSSASILL